MSTNPLFPDKDNPTEEKAGYLLPGKQSAFMSPNNPAVQLIRDKVDRLYSKEPSALDELQRSVTVGPMSKHQRFMQQLSASGKPIAEVQTAWHNYYIGLPDNEKHEVWQEFYAASSSATNRAHVPEAEHSKPFAHRSSNNFPKPAVTKDSRTANFVRQQIIKKLSMDGTLTTKHHLHSLLVGLSAGLVVLIVFLFGFFNEIIIAPLIQPSRQASNTPLILDSSSVAPSATPEVIIPKINVEIPVNYTETSTDENTIENDLQSGIVHYPSTVQPGERGNSAFFGHSSNNIFNKGKYKFAFVLLHTLVPGDTFYLTKDSKVYVYKVILKTVVSPTDVGVLGSVEGKLATATLITCDPPGTSLNRLIVVGEQISPDPVGNTASSVQTNVAPVTLPGNGPTLFNRLWHSLF